MITTGDQHTYARAMSREEVLLVPVVFALPEPFLLGGEAACPCRTVDQSEDTRETAVPVRCRRSVPHEQRPGIADRDTDRMSPAA
ncbi:hypothetical protein [Nocardia sp. X0981]